MINLSNDYDVLGRHADALKLREEALTLQKVKLGLDNPETLRTMTDLAVGYLTAGRIPEAGALLEQAVDRKDPAGSL